MNEIDRIIKDIEKTGFPLEIKISNILKKYEWKVLNQEFYFDLDGNKARTIDICAIKAEHSWIGDYKPFHISLIIECKTSSNPWVFYTIEKDKEFSFPFRQVHHFLRPKNITPEKKIYSEWEKWMPYSHIYDKHIKTARIHYEPFKEGKGNHIFEALNQVTKALHYQLKKIGDTYFKLKKSSPDFCPLFIIYPIIVFEGNIYEYILKDEDFELMPINYLQFETTLYEEEYIVDIIRKKYFQKYLQQLENEISIMKSKLKE